MLWIWIGHCGPIFWSAPTPEFLISGVTFSTRNGLFKKPIFVIPVIPPRFKIRSSLAKIRSSSHRLPATLIGSFFRFQVFFYLVSFNMRSVRFPDFTEENVDVIHFHTVLESRIAGAAHF